MKKFTLFLILALNALNINAQQRLLGGDISMLPAHIKNGAIYRDSTGTERNPYELLTEQGWNAQRVRLFVDPALANRQHKDEGVCQDLPYVLKLCKEIQEAGFQVMLDFHYSDTWADPAKQFTPNAWAELDARALIDKIYYYTREVLQAFKDEGINVDLIQVGNEITFGMCWPLGRVEPDDDNNWDVLSAMLRNGSKACRELYPNAKIIIHTEHAQDTELTLGYYERLERFGVDYDVIGLSYYPMWHGTIPHLGQTIDALDAAYPNKEIQVVEAAFYYSRENDPWAHDGEEFSDHFPISIDGQLQFTRELVDELLSHKVTGLFWWYPEENCYGNSTVRHWLNRGLFNNHNGQALPALYEMKRFNQ